MTPLETKALAFVRDYIGRTGGTSPSYDEIAAAIGRPGQKGRVAVIVERLVSAGKLTKRFNRARSIELVGAGDLTSFTTEQLRAELARRGVTMDALMTPRPIACGTTPRCAHDACLEPVTIGRLFCRPHWHALTERQQRAITQAFGRKDAAAYERAVREARDFLSEVA